MVYSSAHLRWIYCSSWTVNPQETTHFREIAPRLRTHTIHHSTPTPLCSLVNTSFSSRMAREMAGKYPTFYSIIWSTLCKSALPFISLYIKIQIQLPREVDDDAHGGVNTSMPGLSSTSTATISSPHTLTISQTLKATLTSPPGAAASGDLVKVLPVAISVTVLLAVITSFLWLLRRKHATAETVPNSHPRTRISMLPLVASQHLSVGSISPEVPHRAFTQFTEVCHRDTAHTTKNDLRLVSSASPSTNTSLSPDSIGEHGGALARAITDLRSESSRLDESSPPPAYTSRDELTIQYTAH